MDKEFDIMRYGNAQESLLSEIIDKTEEEADTLVSEFLDKWLSKEEVKKIRKKRISEDD